MKADNQGLRNLHLTGHPEWITQQALRNRKTTDWVMTSAAVTFGTIGILLAIRGGYDVCLWLLEWAKTF